jgi:hypothetical protein
MPNITLAMDEELIEKAREFAKSQGTTLNAFVRRLVTDAIAQKSRQEEARRALLELMEESTARLPKGYKFNRAEIYEPEGISRHKRTDLRRGRKAE